MQKHSKVKRVTYTRDNPIKWHIQLYLPTNFHSTGPLSDNEIVSQNENGDYTTCL